ncbi:unnamed protein product [Ectocarpus sp. CCAP 1310/34]|nr:unnamed protein product [Ectocarpus sp. CCAP 1310/34]
MTTSAPAMAVKNLSAVTAAAFPDASSVSSNRSPDTPGEGETDHPVKKDAPGSEVAAAAGPAGDLQAQTATPVMPAAPNQDAPSHDSSSEGVLEVGAAIGPVRENEGGVREEEARESREQGECCDVQVPVALGVGRKGGIGGGGGGEERDKCGSKVAAAGTFCFGPHGGRAAASGEQASAGAAAGTAVASGAGTSFPSVWDLDSLDFEEEQDQEVEEAQADRDHKPEAVGCSRRTKPESHNSSRQDRGRNITAYLQANHQEKNEGGDANVPAGADERPRKKACAGVSTAGRPAAGVVVAAAAAAAAATVLTGPIPIRPVADCGLLRTQPLESANNKRESGEKGDGDGGGGGGGAGAAAAAVVATAVPYNRARELMPPPPPNITRAKMRRRRSRVSLMHSARYQRLCGLLERHNRRDDLLYAMLGACGLPERLSIVAPARATDVHLRAYHDRDYVEALRDAPSDVNTLDEYGLVEDCEVFEELYEHCCAVAGASLHAADRLCRGDADVAINWGGGRHHAKKGEAAGFCYVNDCVLAVLHLAKTFDTVLTIDIDVHHGDGVQDAFYMSDKVMTMSFHHVSKGFFPGAGQCSETGAGNGRHYNLNIPLKEGCGDSSFLRVFTSALQAVTGAFQPEAVVLLCGADTLSADPLGPFNLTSAGVRSCLELVMALELPLLLLGGGGYCPTDTARLWTSLTAAAVGADALAALPVTVPDHCYFPLYGPDFRMATRKKTLPDKNDDDFLDRLCDFAAQAGRRVRAAKKKRERSLVFDAFDFREGPSDSW